MRGGAAVAVCPPSHGISEWFVHTIRDKRLAIITLSLNVCGKPLKQKKKVRDLIFMLRFAQCPRGHRHMSRMHSAFCVLRVHMYWIKNYIYICIRDFKTWEKLKLLAYQWIFESLKYDEIQLSNYYYEHIYEESLFTKCKLE